MLLKEFPDINAVRQLSNGYSNSWPNVALNIRCREVCRTGIEGPYSLFINKLGFSYCTVDKRQYRIETGNFLFTQAGQEYDLIIDNPDQTEIFNIHINKQFFNECIKAVISSDEDLLNDKTSSERSPILFTHLFQKKPQFDRLLFQLEETADFDAALQDIVGHVAEANIEIRKRAARLPFLRTAVREDINRRLLKAIDHMQSNYNRELNIDELCTEIGMSKFHFMRVFKKWQGTTPHQYLNNIRMQKAVHLLKNSKTPVTDIAFDLGFEYPNSFIKAFRKTYKQAPLQYRNR